MTCPAFRGSYDRSRNAGDRAFDAELQLTDTLGQSPLHLAAAALVERSAHDLLATRRERTA